MELNFEGVEMQKWNIPTVRVTRVDEKKKCHLSSYHESAKKYGNPVFSRVDILLAVTKNPIIHSILWKS